MARCMRLLFTVTARTAWRQWRPSPGMGSRTGTASGSAFPRLWATCCARPLRRQSGLRPGRAQDRARRHDRPDAHVPLAYVGRWQPRPSAGSAALPISWPHEAGNASWSLPESATESGSSPLPGQTLDPAQTAGERALDYRSRSACPTGGIRGGLSSSTWALHIGWQAPGCRASFSPDPDDDGAWPGTMGWLTGQVSACLAPSRRSGYGMRHPAAVLAAGFRPPSSAAGAAP
jgi:hypothetical protein